MGLGCCSFLVKFFTARVLLQSSKLVLQAQWGSHRSPPYLCCRDKSASLARQMGLGIDEESINELKGMVDVTKAHTVALKMVYFHSDKSL